MSEQYDEHEQSERVKQWLLKNGSNILTGILLVISAIAGWQWWQSKQLNQGQETANQYQLFINAVDKNDASKAIVLGESLFLFAQRLCKLHNIDVMDGFIIYFFHRCLLKAPREGSPFF